MTIHFGWDENNPWKICWWKRNMTKFLNQIVIISKRLWVKFMNILKQNTGLIRSDWVSTLVPKSTASSQISGGRIEMAKAFYIRSLITWLSCASIFDILDPLTSNSDNSTSTHSHVTCTLHTYLITIKHLTVIPQYHMVYNKMAPKVRQRFKLSHWRPKQG